MSAAQLIAIRAKKDAGVELESWERKILAVTEAKAAPERKAPPAPRYSTAMTEEWIKEQGWTITNRERYDARTGRWKDTPLGGDFDCIDDNGRVVVVQGGCEGSRSSHRRSFEDVGREGKCRAIKVRFLWLEWKRETERGGAPLAEEWWV